MYELKTTWYDGEDQYDATMDTSKAVFGIYALGLHETLFIKYYSFVKLHYPITFRVLEYNIKK